MLVIMNDTNGNDTTEIPRSPLLMSREDTALLVVDLQTTLLNLIPGHKRLVWNTARLIDAARLFDMCVAGTEQYPKGLGGSDPQLAERLPNMPSKLRFSCAACADIFSDFLAKGVRRILVAGIETHVCVLQTVHDLIAEQFDVYIAADAVARATPAGSRHRPASHGVGRRDTHDDRIRLVRMV